MSRPGNPRPDAAELRRRAELRLGEQQPEATRRPTGEDLRRLVHELEVHQLELEMQNEELCRAKEGLEEARLKYADLYDFAPVGYLTLDRDGAIRGANLAAAGLLGTERSRLPGRRFQLFVPEEHRAAFTAFLAKVFAGRATESCEVALQPEARPARFVQLEAAATADGRECRVAALDVTARRRADDALRRLNAELGEALAKVKLLRGLLPICCSCKKIRDEAGYWNQVEVYVHDHSEAELTHGICPECLKKLYPEHAEDKA